MRRYRRARRRSNGMTIPLAPIGGLIAGVAIPAQQAIAGNVWGSGGAIDHLVYNYTGFANNFSGAPEFRIEGLKHGLLPLIGGMLIHKFVGGRPLNVNAMLAKAGVPYIRV